MLLPTLLAVATTRRTLSRNHFCGHLVIGGQPNPNGYLQQRVSQSAAISAGSVPPKAHLCHVLWDPQHKHPYAPHTPKACPGCTGEVNMAGAGLWGDQDRRLAGQGAAGRDRILAAVAHATILLSILVWSHPMAPWTSAS